jgi:hypothetical protein
MLAGGAAVLSPEFPTPEIAAIEMLTGRSVETRKAMFGSNIL